MCGDLDEREREREQPPVVEDGGGSSAPPSPSYPPPLVLYHQDDERRMGAPPACVEGYTHWLPDGLPELVAVEHTDGHVWVEWGGRYAVCARRCGSGAVRETLPLDWRARGWGGAAPTSHQ